MKAWHRASGLLAAALAAGSGCGSSNDAGFASGSESAGPGAANIGGGGSGSGAGNSGSGEGFVATSADGGLAALPSETKTESNYQSPVATGNVVWTANPTNDEVAYIDAVSFTVQTIQAGEGPTYLAAVPDPNDDVAIVQNAASDDATLLRRDSQGDIVSTTFESTADANSWAISASGRWAIAWTNGSLVANAVAAQSFDDIAVMDLSTATANGTGSRPPWPLDTGPRKWRSPARTTRTS